MVGMSETYFAAFYIAVGLSSFQVGLLASLPYLLGSALQLLTPWGVRQVRSYRIWTIATAATQGLSLLALAILTWFELTTFSSLLAVATIYWASGLATGPAWNTWIEFVVPPRIRARYFSVRMRICQLCLLLAIATAGLTLRTTESESEQLLVFVGLFSIAGVLRLMSSNALSRQFEQKSWLASHVQQALRIEEGPDVGLLIRTTIPFFIAMQFAVHISGPYFAPFMLKNLDLGYLQYMILILLGYFGRVLALPFAGKVAQQAGPVRLMLWGAIGIVPMSSLWFFHESFWFLCLIQTASGAAWGCYELAMSLVFIERIPGHHRMRVLSWFNTFNGMAMVGGTVLGGLLLSSWGSTTSAFVTLFLLSGVARVLAFYWFPFAMLNERIPAGRASGRIWQVASPLLNGRSIFRPFFVPERAQGTSPTFSRGITSGITSVPVPEPEPVFAMEADLLMVEMDGHNEFLAEEVAVSTAPLFPALATATDARADSVAM
jgi:hypothetical protein